MPPTGGQTTTRSRRAARRAVRRRVPPAPSPQTLARQAHAQQSAYVSQGRAVQRVATHQRAAQNIRRTQARSKPLAATPMRHPRAGRPVRSQAHVNQIVAAVNRQSRSVAADRQRQVRAAARTRAAAVRAASRSGGDLGGPHRNLAQRIVAALAPRNVYGGGPHVAGGARGNGIATSRGISTASVRGVAGSVPGLAVREIGLAIAEKPKLAADLPGQVAKYAVGAPAGLVESIAHPRAAASSSVSDIGRRYGALARGDTQAFRKRILKEGIAPEVLDLASAAGGATAVGGRVLGAAARAGKLGARLERISTVRPVLRISGNVAREQEVAPNLVRNVTRAAVDARRRTVQARRAARQDAPVEVRLAQERGEVTYTSRRRQGREQRRLVAQEKGTEVQRLKMVQQREHSAALKNLHSLTKDERRGFALAHQFGATSPDAARNLIRRRQRDIAAHRDTISTTISKRRDQLPELQWLHDNAEKVFTPKLRQVVRQEQARERRITARDPGVDLTQAQLRRYQPLAAALGIERRTDVPLQESLLDQPARAAGEAPPVPAGHVRLYRGEGVHVRGGADWADAPEGGPSQGRWFTEDLSRAKGYASEGQTYRKGYVKYVDVPEDIARAHRIADNGRSTYVLPDEVARRAGELDPGSAAEAYAEHARRQAGMERTAVVSERRARARAALRGEEPPKPREKPRQHRGETNGEFLRRVIRESRAQGLERPGYLHSEERAKGVFATMALGGSKATNIPGRAYTGSLLRQGVESMDPNVHLQGIARGLKRRQQWNMVARNFERHSIDKLQGKSLRNRDILSLTRDLENAGVDLGSVSFWNPRKFYEASQRAARDTEGTRPEELGGDEVLHGSSDVHTALQRAVESPAEVLANPDAFKDARGFSVVPTAVLKEIEGSVRPEGLLSRMVDISRGKISRVLLGNPAWLTFQVASNAFLTGLAGVGPIDAIKAQRWWSNLSDAEKEALAPEVGVHGWYDEQTKLGATRENLPALAQRMANGWAAMKQTPMYQLAHKANPLDAIFRADNAQNNFFRKAVFYNQAKREAYRRMGDNATRMIRAQQGINRVLKLDPQERITAAAKDPKVFEHHARAVRDFLGDYTSYTSRERARLGRYAMFYGFLRHSLRLTFYTLPVKHPLMTAIGLELGKMHDEELRKLFGVDPPAWEQANAYINIGGKTRKFAIGRLNPFFNAVQFEGPGSLVQLGTPLAAIAMDQLAAKNVAFDRPWTVGGSGSYVSRGRDVTAAQRAKIALAEALHLSPYVRLAEKTGIPGVRGPMEGRQTDESSLIFPDPVRYKQGAAAGRNATRIAEQRRVSPGRNLLETLVPVLGTDAAPTIRSSRDYAAGQGAHVPVPSPGGSLPKETPAMRALERAAERRGHGNLSSAQMDALEKAARRAGGG